jgi:predicted transcriptional regulator
MQTFVDSDRLNNIIEELAKRGWVIWDEKDKTRFSKLEVTEKGKECHQALLSLQKGSEGEHWKELVMTSMS